MGKSQRSVHVISDLVLRFTCYDSCSMSIDVATSTFYALRSLRFLRSGYALYALRSGTVKKCAFYASYIIRSTSRSTFYFYVPPREPMDLFPRCREDKVEAGRCAKPVVYVNVSPLDAAIAFFSRARRRLRVEHAHSRPAKLATNLTPSPVCYASDLALCSLDDCVAVIFCDE